MILIIYCFSLILISIIGGEILFQIRKKDELNEKTKITVKNYSKLSPVLDVLNPKNWTFFD